LKPDSPAKAARGRLDTVLGRFCWRSFPYLENSLPKKAEIASFTTEFASVKQYSACQRRNMPICYFEGMNIAQSAPPSEAGFIDEKELLTRLPVSRRTVFSWVQSGKLPCVKIGRRKIYHWPSCEGALLRMQRGAGQ
jgi:hypothetical protein